MTATPRVAVLGWGSLIWDPEILAPSLTPGADGAPAWALGAGPTLPLEFSRISPKRLGALALVIDPEQGASSAVHVAEHVAPEGADGAGALAAAVADLAARERAPQERIGRAPAADLDARPVGAAIAAWLAGSGYVGAVWTDLRPNFAEIMGAPFSLAAARAHLMALDGASAAEAVGYIERAPAAADTPLRRALAADPAWRARVADWSATKR